MLDNRTFWRRFRLAALLILIPLLMGIQVFLVSYFAGREKLDVDGSERIYFIHPPRGYDAERSYPVLLVFHMRMGNAWMMQQITHFNQLADHHEFIVLYPDGFGRSWADGSQRYEVDKAGVDDIQFVKELLSTTENLYAINSN